MSFFNSMNVSASGLTAQSLRMDIISENIANANTTKTENGTPYKAKTVLFQQENPNKPFADYFDSSLTQANRGAGVRVTDIVADKSEGPMVYNPNHPDANSDGYVEMPNVNIVEQMVNMISASRSYEANITAMNSTKSMISKTMEIGR